MPPQKDEEVGTKHNEDNIVDEYPSLPPSYQHQTTGSSSSHDSDEHSSPPLSLLPPTRSDQRQTRRASSNSNRHHSTDKGKNHHCTSTKMEHDTSDSSSCSGSEQGEEQEPQHELTQIRHGNGPRSYGHVQTTEQYDDDHDNNNTATKRTISIDDAVEMLGMGAFQYRILLAAGLCFAADSMEVLLLSFLAVVLKVVWDLTDHETAAITSSVFMGALMGTIILGRAGDVMGRKPVFTLTAGIICTSGFLTAVANNFWTLLAFRFMVGFGVGGLTTPFDVMAEVVPGSQRGFYCLFIEYFASITHSRAVKLDF